MKRDKLITEHYLLNYERLVKRTIWRVPNKSKAIAEECVQEAYARALKYFSTFDERKDLFERWFEGILRNAIHDCRDIEKSRGVSQELSDEDGAELVPYRKEKLIAIAVLRDMREDTNKLILSMFLLYGFKTKDIAEYTGMTHTNVRQIIYKFRNNMNGFLNTPEL
jgi:RNA polymerase sigma factor (sigma-70 family)